MAKILLVEDDNNLREIYEARLQAEGYDIVSARDGEEALTIAMKERPDLIISDVMMPKISGFDMLDIIRSTEETKNAKVIMMTALSQAEDKERASKLGADRYLVKSQVTLEDVAKVAREVLSGESDQNSTPPPAQSVPAIAQVLTTPAPSEPAVVVAAPVDEPVAATPAPAPEPVPAPEPSTTTVPDTATTAPVITAPEPVATPSTPADEPVATQPIVADYAVANIIQATPAVSTVTDSTSPGLAAIAPAQDDTATSESTEPIEQSVENEQSAIAAQIESFIDAKKPEVTEQPTPETVPEPTVVEAPVAVSEPEPAPAPEPAPEPEPVPVEVKPVEPQVVQADASESVSQKVIQPLTDPTASKSTELNRLLEEEEEREKMEEIAKSVVAENAASERDAMSEPSAEIATDSGIEVAPEPQFIETPAPIIPHSNGSSLDGVIPAQPKPPESADPENIAL